MAKSNFNESDQRSTMALLWVFFIAWAALLGLLVCLSNNASALEADYAMPWCEQMGGQSEVVLADRTRVDCLLPGFAVEVDKAKNWAEAMGQALHYARMTGKLPGIMLIIEERTDWRFVDYLYGDADKFGLPLYIWTVEAGSDGADE